MRILLLGGTHHVGRALAESALARGHQVTTLTRGVSGRPAEGVDARYADRTDPDAMAAALGADRWDAVLDTWSAEPAAVQSSARLLAGRVGHYGYVSSRSVYTWPIAPDADESAPVVNGDPASTDSADYAAAKRGAELALREEFDPLVARAGLILGPYEIVGRLPWWLNRIAAGGQVAAPGPVDRPLQYIDGRDLAEWMIGCAESGVTGTYNTVSRPGHTTIGELLTECNEVTGSRAKLVWVPPEVIERNGVGGWVDLPIWVPPTGELTGLHAGDVSAAYAAGLVCRPVADTVADTWSWLQREGMPDWSSGRVGALGISAEVEQQLLAAVSTR